MLNIYRSHITDWNSFWENVVLDTFNKVVRNEDKILDRIYIMVNLIFYKIIRKCIMHKCSTKIQFCEFCRFFAFAVSVCAWGCGAEVEGRLRCGAGERDGLVLFLVLEARGGWGGGRGQRGEAATRDEARPTARKSLWWSRAQIDLFDVRRPDRVSVTSRGHFTRQDRYRINYSDRSREIKST